MEKDFKKSEWGEDKQWGIAKVKYLPTGEITEHKIGIKRLGYSNELVFADTWGYDKGHPTDLNHPDNYKLISIKKLPIRKKLQLSAIKRREEK